MDAEARSWSIGDDEATTAGRGEDIGPAKAPFGRSPWALAWGLGRTPLVLLIAFLFRVPLLDAIERAFDIVWITELVIDVMSTPVARLGLLVGSLVVLLLAWSVVRRLSPPVAWLAGSALGTALILAVVEASGSSRKLAVSLAVVLLLNWLPQSAGLEASGPGRLLRRLVAVVPLLSEGLLAPRYLAWLRRSAGVRPGGAETLWRAAVPGAAVVALGLAVFLRGTTLAPIERALRSGPDVTLMAKGDFNGLELDKTGQALFATGHGLAHLTRYDLVSGRVSQSVETTGGAQDLAYDLAADEVLMFDTARKAVLVFASESLELRRVIPAPELSPGDPWILADDRTDTLLLSSEADEEVGSPLLVLDRSTGKVLDRRPEAAGNVLRRPGSNLVYLSFFRRGQGLLAYDLAKLRYVARTPTDERVDRMAYDGRRNELLVASPVAGRVLRYDGDTLRPRPPVETIFGVRVIAIDAPRDLMLVGSLSTGKVAAVSLADHRLLKTWYVGPWPRSIALDSARGRAFVSSNGALYRLDYAKVTPRG
jgi:hypothetical protein